MVDIHRPGRWNDTSKSESDTDVSGSGEDANGAFIPSDKSAIPPTGDASFFVEPLNNLAKDKQLTADLLAWANNQWQYYNGQGQREKFCGASGVMDIADRMYRVAERRDTSSKQYQTTLSDVPSTMFYKQHRTLVANLRSIYFQDSELPAKYEPEVNTTEYTYESGQQIALYHNMLEQFTFDEDKRKQKVHDFLNQLVKYGNAMVSIEWDRQEQTVRERKPVQFDEQGNPTEFQWDDAIKRTTKDCPSLILHDLKDCWFDATIDDIQKQRCLLIREQVTYERLLGDQAAGFITNVESIDTSMLYRGDNESDNVIEQRYENADENAVSEPNGLFELWHVWCRVPIKEHKRKASGKWDTKSSLPTLYWATFVGDLQGGKATCVRLIKCPYYNGQIPYKMIHSHWDDKGAYHVGLSNMLEPLYWQNTTNVNQAIDNVTLANRAPYIAEGPLFTRNLEFGPNKVVSVPKGTTITRMVIPDRTGMTINMAKSLEDDANQTAGTDKPLLGQPVGGRQTATAATQVLDQAILPIDAMASYIADQLFDWMLESDAAQWRQWGNPVLMRGITNVNEPIGAIINPAELYGPIKTRVVAVDRFRNNAVNRMQMNTFISGSYPLAAEIMGEDGKREFWRQAFKMAGFENVNELVPLVGDYDAQARALEEARSMILMGTWVEPLKNENHKQHLAVLRPLLVQYKNLPEGEFDPQRFAMLEAHIQQREQIMEQKESASVALQAGGGGGMGVSPETPAGMEGQALGDQLSGQQQGV
jgi:hypothetical protein